MENRQDKGSRPTKRVFKSSDADKRRIDKNASSRAAKKPSAEQEKADPKFVAMMGEKKPEPETSSQQTASQQPVSQQPTDRLSASQRTTRHQDGQQRTSSRQAANQQSAPRQATGRLSATQRTASQQPVSQQAATQRTASQQPIGQQVTSQQAADAQPSDQQESSQQPTRQLASRKPARRQPTKRQPPVVSEAGEAGEPDGASAREDAQAGQPASAGVPRRLRPPAVPRRRVAALVGAGVLVVLLVAAGVFAFNRWMRYDDHADLQGTWYIYNTDVPITIDAEYIHFNDEVSYRYTIDSTEKTMSYTFGPMQGQGRYWFSDDRTHLVITDGDGFTAAGTTVEDLLHAFIDFGVVSSGDAVELPAGEGIIAFSRQPEVGLTDEQVAQKAEEQAFRERAGNPTVEGFVARSAATGAAAIEWTLENRYYDYNPYTGSYYYFFGQSSYGGATDADNGSYYGDGASYDGQQYYQDEYYNSEYYDYGQTTYADAAGYYEEVG